MRKTLALLSVFALSLRAFGAETYSEFYCQNDGTNVNAGSTTSAPVYQYWSGNFTNRSSTIGDFFTAASQDLSGVSAGMWASVFTNTETSHTWFVGKILAVDDANDYITICLTNKGGIIVPSDGVGDRAIVVGGPWKGPNTLSASSGDGFPFYRMAGMAMTNSPYAVCRVNFKNDQIYYTTNTITTTNIGPTVFQGYTTTPGDGGRAIFDGSQWAGAAFTFFNPTSAGQMLTYADFIVRTNGASGANIGGFQVGSTYSTFRRITVYRMRGYAISLEGQACFADECESYENGIGHSGNNGTFMSSTAGSVFYNCIAYSNNLSVYTCGFYASGNVHWQNCISYKNGQDGFRVNTSLLIPITMLNCDAYANVSNGLTFVSTAANKIRIQNNNFIDNGGYGMYTRDYLRTGFIRNNGFGSGTMTNDYGSMGSGFGSCAQSDNVTFAADTTPWTDPDNGNFTQPTNSVAFGLGRASWVQAFVNSPTNTVSYIQIGANTPTNYIVTGAPGAATTRGLPFVQ